MNDEIFASHFVTTFAQLDPLAQIEDMNDSFISSIHARKPFISSRRSYPPFVPKKRSYPQGVHILGPCQADHSYLQTFMPASAAIIAFTPSRRSYLPSMPNIALTPLNHPNPLCITKNGTYRSKVCIWHAPHPNPCDTAPKHKPRSPFAHQPQKPLTARTR